MYNINWQKFVFERISSPIRKVVMQAWVHALLSPVKALHTAFLILRDTEERGLKITPQVRVLTYWLNELFDPGFRGIRIEDFVNVQPVLVWGEIYNDPLYLPEFLSSKAFDFTVFLPIGLQAQEVQIRSFLDTYKLAGKRYNLIYG